MKPTPQTQAEADRVELVYQYVLAQLGAKTVNEVLALWAGIPAGQAAQTASTWLSRAVSLILTRRGQAKALGLAYYRVARALRTGTTVSIEEAPETISLEMLRQEFEALVAEHTGEGTTRISASPEPDSDDDSIEVETLSGVSEALEADETASQEYVETLLEEMATTASNKVSGMAAETPLAEARTTERELHLQHGAMIAAAGARTAMNGGRNATNQVSARDPRVIGWVRQSTTGAPCYFCAMLISRRVLYKSAFTAGKGQREVGLPPFLGDGMFKFHDNCKCTAVEVYSDADFQSHSKYAPNRYYGDLWDKHIKGKHSGSDAINEWRKLLQRIRPKTTEAAPEAA